MVTGERKQSRAAKKLELVHVNILHLRINKFILLDMVKKSVKSMKNVNLKLATLGVDS